MLNVTGQPASNNVTNICVRPQRLMTLDSDVALITLYRHSRRQRRGKDQSDPLPGPGEPGRLRERSPVRVARSVRRDSSDVAELTQHHASAHRAAAAGHVVWSCQGRQLTAGDAAWRYVRHESARGSGPDLRGAWGQGPRPPTKPFQFLFRAHYRVN